MARIYGICIVIGLIAAVGIGAACDEVEGSQFQCKLDLMMANGKVVTITIDKDYYESLIPGMEVELESVHFKGKRSFIVEWHEYSNEKEHYHNWKNSIIQLNEKGYKPHRKAAEKKGE
jgi:NADPH:quinone reductase-like Zn-dependent oxidoreductase